MSSLLKTLLCTTLLVAAAPSFAGKTTGTGGVPGTPIIPSTADKPVSDGEVAGAPSVSAGSGAVSSPAAAIAAIVGNTSAALASGKSAASVAASAQAAAASVVSAASPQQVQSVVSAMTRVVSTSGGSVLFSRTQAVAAVGILRALAAQGSLNATLLETLAQLEAAADV